MNQLWAPWRGVYIETPKPDGRCLFCAAREGVLEDGRVLHNGQTSVVMMNKYPYNSGHLLIAPARHVGLFEGLTDEEGADSHRLIRHCVMALTALFKPDGFNIGMNIGRAAGAGIDGHLHAHVVPRWNGDVNFLPVLADVKVMPQHIEEIYGKLKPYFDKID